MDPALLKEAVAAGVREGLAGAVPYPWVVSVVGFLVFVIGVVGKMYLGEVKEGREVRQAYLEFAKTAMPILEAAKERLKERSHGGG